MKAVQDKEALQQSVATLELEVCEYSLQFCLLILVQSTIHLFIHPPFIPLFEEAISWLIVSCVPSGWVLSVSILCSCTCGGPQNQRLKEELKRLADDLQHLTQALTKERDDLVALKTRLHTGDLVCCAAVLEWLLV